MFSLPELWSPACVERGKPSVRETVDPARSRPGVDLSWVSMSSDPTGKADCLLWTTCDTVVPLVCAPALQSSHLPPSLSVPQPTGPLRG